MSPVKNQLVHVIDCLSEADLALLLEVAKRLIPDDVATFEDLQAVTKAREEYQNGETVSHDAIVWDEE